MKKTLIALAALATVSSSFAQSSVTISGFMHGSYDTFSIKNAGATRTGNKSENRVTDNSSRIIFGVVEDLGGGLSAVGQVDMRFALDAQNRVGPDNKPADTTRDPVANTFTSGNNHVGLVSKDLGGIRLGRQDIHYTEGGHFNHTSTGTIASSINVLHSNGSSGGSIANWSRTPNLLWYTSPTIAGFSATLGTSTNALRTSGGYMEQENDMALVEVPKVAEKPAMVGDVYHSKLGVRDQLAMLPPEEPLLCRTLMLLAMVPVDVWLK